MVDRMTDVSEFILLFRLKCLFGSLTLTENVLSLMEDDAKDPALADEFSLHRTSLSSISFSVMGHILRRLLCNDVITHVVGCM